MTEKAYMDPLKAASELLTFIMKENEKTRNFRELASRIDTFVYALRYLLIDSIASIQQTDDEPPSEFDKTRRALIGPRFPELGFYWVALDSDCSNEGKIATGDAIDDLADIAGGLKEVQWFLEHHGRDEALAALRWQYESHLWMHVMPLRAHLEELIYSP